MALLNCEFFSETLGINTSMKVILPQNHSLGINSGKKIMKKNTPLLYLLHGYSDNHTGWTRYTSVERYVNDANIAVVMPAVDLSYYTDMKYGNKYWEFISEELPLIVESFFKITIDPKLTFVAGLSMGGYGAFKLALTFPKRYRAAGSFSGALDVKGIHELHQNDQVRDKSFNIIFGEKTEELKNEDDLFFLLEKYLKDNKEMLPKLYQCCGTDDYVYKFNKKFLNALRERGLSIDYFEEKAEHTWDYWDRSIDKFIKYIKPMLANKDI